MMDDSKLLRYSRQMMLPEIDIEGQQRLADAHIVIAGLGGLGSSASIYLAASGIGHLTLIDPDTVDLSNLQRQIIHTTDDIGRLKTDSAKEYLLALNPEVNITAIPKKIENIDMQKSIKSATVMLDCSDNFAARFAINDICCRYKIPLVSAAAIRFEAQISTFNTNHECSPCYRCIYSNETTVRETCMTNGVISPLLGIVGSIQACEAIKTVAGFGETLEGKLLLLDIMRMDWHMAKLNKDPKCPACRV